MGVGVLWVPPARGRHPQARRVSLFSFSHHPLGFILPPALVEDRVHDDARVREMSLHPRKEKLSAHAKVIFRGDNDRRA